MNKLKSATEFVGSVLLSILSLIGIGLTCKLVTYFFKIGWRLLP